VIATVRSLDGFIAESARSARRFLKSIGFPVPLQAIAIAELNEHTAATELPALLAPARDGRRIGLMSDAGCPGIADPGGALVALAHREGVRVVPLVGPSSLLLALMACGLSGQRFCFHGYLPIPEIARRAALARLEADAWRDGSAQAFIETPYRNNQLLTAILATCRADTSVCLATDLTLAGESVRTRAVRDWRRSPPDLHRHPTVFVLQA
jgi:16S rRNA (cytidine1402-2'-O)-methyltransferase